jgi:hypothetical protein
MSYPRVIYDDSGNGTILARKNTARISIFSETATFW